MGKEESGLIGRGCQVTRAGANGASRLIKPGSFIPFLSPKRHHIRCHLSHSFGDVDAEQVENQLHLRKA